MDRLRAVTLQARRIDLQVVDAVVSPALIVCAIADAHAQLRHGSFGGVAVVCCVVCGGSVAARRRWPGWACFAACTSYAALVLITGYNGSGVFEWVPVSLTFYTVGRHPAIRHGSWVAAGLFAYWLSASGLAYGIEPAGSAGVLALGSYAVGRWFAGRSSMIEELMTHAAALEREQALRAREAVEEERRGMARELHDVVAHCVSVMVVQTAGARSVAAADPSTARGALRAVEAAGREALVELRRIVGVLHRDAEPLSDVAAPSITQLDTLVERARTAGVHVELSVDGARRGLPAGLDLVVYRLVQEGLTNVIKHSSGGAARVWLSYEARELQVEVSDTGGRSATAAGEPHHGAGHGLRGMRERVALYGGDLAAGPLPTGGFAVRARVPYSTQSLPVATRDTPHSEANAPDERVRWQWLDRLLAVLTLVVLERRVLSSSHIRSQLILSTVVVAAISLAVMWRRRHPVVFATSVALLDLMLIWLGPFKHTIFTICLWAWVLYTVAAWTGRRVAITLLGCIVGVFSLGQVLGTNDTNAAQFAGVLFLMCVPWGCGIAVQSRRHLTHQLERLSSQLSQEREDRARLAVASERSRIARELHAAVAGSVAAMVVQAEAAVTALDQDGRAADPIMDAIEATGRTTLAEMRRILGVLRRPGESPELEPQPGIDQIHALIRRARASGQMVQMTVEGEPGILTSGVEIGVYRILNDALAAARAKPERPVEVALTFGSDELELRIRADVNDWPTSVMRESAAMCHGKLIAHREPDGHCGLLARMPTEYQGALA